MSKNQILELLKENKGVFISRYGVNDIAVFGSYATEHHDVSSDIDILVDSYRTFDNYMELKFFIEDLTNLKVDLALKNTIRKEFRESIAKKALYV